MSRNFNLGSRDMGRAGQMALNSAAQVGAVSYSTAATNGNRWDEFAAFAKEELSIKYMEHITTESVVAYGEALKERVVAGEMSAATAQNYVSAVNSVMSLATQGQWQSVSPTKDCGIDARTGIAQESKATNQAQHDNLKSAVDERLGALLDLQRSLGLRFEESAKLNATIALAEARQTDQVSITLGTKGGLNRTVPASPEAIEALEQAAAIQGRDRSMIPSRVSYAAFQSEAYRNLAAASGVGFHGERHAFAQARYRALTGAPAPVSVGWKREERFQRMAAHLGVSETDAKAIDQEARLQVAKELGHGRVEVSNAYLG